MSYYLCFGELTPPEGVKSPVYAVGKHEYHADKNLVIDSQIFAGPGMSIGQPTYHFDMKTKKIFIFEGSSDKVVGEGIFEYEGTPENWKECRYEFKLDGFGKMKGKDIYPNDGTVLYRADAILNAEEPDKQGRWAGDVIRIDEPLYQRLLNSLLARVKADPPPASA